MYDFIYKKGFYLRKLYLMGIEQPERKTKTNKTKEKIPHLVTLPGEKSSPSVNRVSIYQGGRVHYSVYRSL